VNQIELDEEKVLVIVPTLGEREFYLMECLDSLVKQTFPPYVIVGYPLRSEAKLASFKKKYPSVQFEQIEGSQIEVINRIAFENCHFKYMNWLGDDDRLPSRSIERSVEVLDTHPNVHGTFGGVLYIDDVGRRIGNYLPPKFAQRLICFVPAAIKLEAGLFLTQDFIAVGGIDSQLKLAPDVFLTIKLRSMGRWQRIKEDLCEFRIHPDSATAANRIAGLKEATQIQMSLGNNLERALNLFLRCPIYLAKILFFFFMSSNIKLQNKS
jgi:hypothetical protein